MALQGLDWDCITADDIYAVVASAVDPTFSVDKNRASTAVQRKLKKGSTVVGGDESNEEESENDGLGLYQCRRIKRVRIYVSDFGKAELEKEKLRGPDFGQNVKLDDQTGEADLEAVRAYNVKKSRYASLNYSVTV